MRIAVIGLGLIGGSLLRALAAAGHAVCGYDADPATRATARTASAQTRTHARWQVAGGMRDAVADADLAVVAVPLTAVDDVLDGLVGAGFTGLVTDVTSVKAPVRDAVEHHLHRAHSRLASFVGGHPMAGRETSGFDAAEADLFTGCAWALCLDADTSVTDWLTVADLVARLGARVVPATAQEHDHAVAAVSHVPHLLAAALAASVADHPLARTLAAGSFRDGTRVAASPPALTATICAGNPETAVPALDEVMAALTRAREALTAPYPVSALRDWLVSGATVRHRWPPASGARATLAADAEALRELGRAGGWVTAVHREDRTVTVVYPATEDS